MWCLGYTCPVVQVFKCYMHAEQGVFVLVLVTHACPLLWVESHCCWWYRHSVKKQHILYSLLSWLHKNNSPVKRQCDWDAREGRWCTTVVLVGSRTELEFYYVLTEADRKITLLQDRSTHNSMDSLLVRKHKQPCLPAFKYFASCVGALWLTVFRRLELGGAFGLRSVE